MNSGGTRSEVIQGPLTLVELLYAASHLDHRNPERSCDCADGSPGWIRQPTFDLGEMGHRDAGVLGDLFLSRATLSAKFPDRCA